MKRIYVAGPYTKPDPVVNTRKAIEAANELFDLGYAPYVPHLTLFWHFAFPRPYEDWMRLDFQWVKQCDALLRLPGESSGADREVIVAQEAGIPVFRSIYELKLGLEP